MLFKFKGQGVVEIGIEIETVKENQRETDVEIVCLTKRGETNMVTEQNTQTTTEKFNSGKPPPTLKRILLPPSPTPPQKKADVDSLPATPSPLYGNIWFTSLDLRSFPIM